MKDFEGTDNWTLTHEGKVQLNYMHDLFEQGFDLEQIADICKTQVWCIKLLFELDSRQHSKETENYN